MVTVISGGSHSGRDKVFIDKIKSAVKNGEQVMVIIPDQFSLNMIKNCMNTLVRQISTSYRLQALTVSLSSQRSFMAVG